MTAANKRRGWVWLALPVLIGGAAYGMTRYASAAGPVADGGGEFLLDPTPNQHLVVTEAVLRNRGRQPLELTNFRGSCPTCLTFGILRDGSLESIDHLTLPPGESETITVRLLVYGGPTKPFAAFITCDTNDPRQPELTLLYRAAVLGSIRPFPPSVDFGPVRPGQPVRQRVALYDTGRGTPLRPLRVESANADAVHCDIVLGPAARSDAPAGSGEAVAALDLSVVAPASGWTLDGTLTVYEDGESKPLAVVPVRGAVPPLVRVSPATVQVPRTVAGRADYSAECHFRTPDGKPLAVSVEAAPPGLAVRPLDAAGPAEAGYRIEWQSHPDPTATVAFRATVGDRSETVRVVVRCTAPREAGR